MRALLFTLLRVRKDIARVALGVLFILASSLHFTSDAELKLIPEFLPWRQQALYITGIFELLGGVGLLIPRFQRAAAWGLVALLIAVFPANVYHAVTNIQLGGILNSRLYQWGRLPIQGVFIWWALWATSPDTAARRLKSRRRVGVRRFSTLSEHVMNVAARNQEGDNTHEDV